MDALSRLSGFEDAQPDMINAILSEAGNFSDQVLAPLNVVGEHQGSTFDQGKVTMPEGWKTYM